MPFLTCYFCNQRSVVEKDGLGVTRRTNTLRKVKLNEDLEEYTHDACYNEAVRIIVKRMKDAKLPKPDLSDVTGRQPTEETGGTQSK